MSRVICTAKNITDEQIETLRIEAGAAGDEDLVCAAIIATEGEFDSDEWAALSPSREAKSWTRDEAIEVCVRAINAARDAAEVAS